MACDLLCTSGACSHVEEWRVRKRKSARREKMKRRLLRAVLANRGRLLKKLDGVGEVVVAWAKDNNREKGVMVGGDSE